MPLFYFFFIQLQLSAFSPYPSTPSQPVPPPSPTSTLPLDFVLVSFIVALIDPSPLYPLPLKLDEIPYNLCIVIQEGIWLLMASEITL